VNVARSELSKTDVLLLRFNTDPYFVLHYRSDNKTRTDSDEIFNRSTTVYNADHASSRTFVESTTEYIKIPFKMVLPDVTDADIGGPGSALSLPPSLCSGHVQKDRYM
jgi:hypothetical protein